MQRKAIYYFLGEPLATRSDDFAGPTSQDYLAEDSIPLHIQKVEYDTCFTIRPVNVVSSIAIDAPSGVAAQATIDSIDAQVQQTGKPDAGATC